MLHTIAARRAVVTGSLCGYVENCGNSQRIMDLEPSQCVGNSTADCGANMIPMLAEEAKKRQEAGTANLKNQQDARSSPIGDDRGENGRSVAVAAKALGIDSSSVGRAMAVKKKDPEIFEKVKRGWAMQAPAARYKS